MLHRYLRLPWAAALLICLPPVVARAQSTTFYPAAIGDHGVLTVDSHDTYYDGTNGTLFVPVPLPPGATQLRFRVTGAIPTDGGGALASPDGLYADGRAPYNNTETRYNGTYAGVPVGGTTGIDPALFGVFFNPAFTGTPKDSENYRSDSGIAPDPRTYAIYRPEVNQPFHIGDGYDANNPFITPNASFVPAGQIQTFIIPPGATQLLLGIGSDRDMSDNGSSATFQVHVYDDVPSAAAHTLAFRTQPGSPGSPGAAFARQPVVVALNAAGAVDTSFAGPVTLSVKSGTGSAGAAVVGTATVNAVAGVATFTTVGVDRPGTAFVLWATGGGLAGAYSQPFDVYGTDHGPGFHQSSIAPNGVLLVDSLNTYYDASDGTLSAAVPLPAGATRLQFRVTGGVITDGTGSLASPDGLYADGRVPYNFTDTRFGGTYKGVPVGSTTGIDPAVFGVFFSPSFTGTPPPSDNYRGDAPLPDRRTSSTYAPQVNQPVWIGDGLTANNAFATSDDAYIPAGTIQTFAIPPGATQLLLGIGADVALSDNRNGTTTTAFRVHVYDDSAAQPPVRLAFRVQPKGGQPGEPLAVQPEVVALDAGGNLAYGFSGPVALSLKPGTATLSGAATVSASDGVAHFAGLAVDRAGVNYALVASAAGLPPVTSLPFDVPSPLVFNAAADFSTTRNPNGPWSYGYETARGAAFQLLSQAVVLNGTINWWNEPSIAWVGAYLNLTATPQVSADTTFQPGQLTLHPGNGGQLGVLRWTAPAGGVYRLKVRFTGIAASPTSSDIAVQVNGATVFSGFLNGQSYPNSVEYVLAQPYKVGDTVDFLVGCGERGCTSDSTAVDVQIGTFADLNASGQFEMEDVKLALRIAGGLSPSTADQMAKGDFATDGRLTVGDALALLRMLTF